MRTGERSSGATDPSDRLAIEPGEWTFLALILALALALRLLHLHDIRANDPFFTLPAPDPLFYHEWALAILSGDWLGDGVFLQGPLYPYLLALFYEIGGVSPLVPRIAHVALGVLTCLLVWLTGRELFDRRVALVAAGISSAYAMAIFYEGSFLIANVQPLLNLLLVLALVRALARPALLRFALAGCLLGLSSLARPNVMLMAPLVVAWVAWGRGIDVAVRAAGRLRAAGKLRAARRLALALAFVAGFSLCLAPSLARNYAVAGDLVLVSASAGMNFYNGNNPDATGVHAVPRDFDKTIADHPLEQNVVYREYAERALGRPLLASEVSQYWLGRGLEWVTGAPGDWLALVGRKLSLFLNAFEPWSNRSFTLSRQFSRVLRLPLFTFGFVAPLALLGIALTLRDWRRLFPLHALLVVYTTTALVFFVLSRYRMPVVPVFVLFAAVALVWLWDAARERRLRQLALALPALGLLAGFVHRDAARENLAIAHYNHGNKQAARGEWQSAVESYEKSLDIDPYYVSAHKNLALARESQGLRQEAVAAWRHVLALARERELPEQIEVAERHLRALGADVGRPRD